MSLGFEISTSTDWLEVSNATQLIDNYPGGEMQVQSYIMNGTFAYIDSVIESTGVVPQGMTVGDAKLIPNGSAVGDRLRLWIKLQPA